MERRFVNLTFDLEEFDIPEEYGQKISQEDQMKYTLEGMERLMKVLDKHAIRVTFFTTGNFADRNKGLVKELSANHEIASHAYYHAPHHAFSEHDIWKSKKVLEEITGKNVTGFRMPRLRPFDISLLKEWGFIYDSSINPTYLPGRYNLLHKSPQPYLEQGLWELPCSTMPWTRFPLFWLSFKNLPLSLYAWMCKVTLKRRENLMLYFHPWEFADISDFKLPGYVKSPNGAQLTQKLDHLIDDLLQQKVSFVTCQEYCETLSVTERSKSVTSM